MINSDIDLSDEQLDRERIEEPHALPGHYCPTCGEQHCSNAKGHKWNDDDYCVHCGADGRA